MSQQLTTINSRLPRPINAPCKPEQWRVLTDAIFPNAKTAESVMMALEYCRVRNLDPFKRPVHIVPMYSTASRKMIETVWPGINELQVTAARSGAWAGMDEPQWGPVQEYVFTGGGGEDQNGQPLPARTVTVKVPESCTVTVYRVVNGLREAFSEPVYWLEAYAKAGRGTELPNEMWARRPRGQLHKCAKAASLRAAFPEDLGSTYAAEEMEDREIDAKGPVIDATAQAADTEIRQEEESEFIIRADQRLTATGANGTAWLREFLAILSECPTEADLATLRGWEPVRKAETEAPTLIRKQVSEAIQAAQARLAGVLATEAAPSTAKPDEDADSAQALLRQFQTLKTDVEVQRLANQRETKTQMADYKARRPDLFKLVEDGIVAHRRALNDPGALPLDAA